MTPIVAVLVAPFAILTFVLGVELFAGLRPLAMHVEAADPNSRVVIIVPAHNEETVLRRSLEYLKRATPPALGRILVVADNCTDSTPTIAREAGVDLLVRMDPVRRGKGFALDFARNHLRGAPPEIVIIVDADCIISERSLALLASACETLGRPCQSVYLQEPCPGGSPKVQLSTFAFFVKNVIRQRALQRLAGRVHLGGTGMAFPWEAFALAELRHGSIVEDLVMGIELADKGYPATLIENATVVSEPAAEGSLLDQRRRWEGGYLQTAAQCGPRALVRALWRLDFRGVWSAISLFIPPLAMLMTLDLLVLLFAILCRLLRLAVDWPAIALAACLLFASFGIVAAWVKGGSRFVGLRTLARVPLYIGWKLPLYLGLARKGAPREWMRTDRG